MKNAVLASLLACFLVACSTPPQYTETPMTAYDKDTDYAVDEKPDGFDLSIYYSRFQYFPDTGALMGMCRSQLTSLAHDLSDKRGRKIENVNEQRIKISTGRNEITGITSCTANAAVKWAK